MPPLSHFIRPALRSLRRAPAFSITTVAVLALGIGMATTLFSVLHAALYRPLPYPRAERLMACATTFDGVPNPDVSAPDYWDFRADLTQFEGLAAQLYGARRSVVLGGERPTSAQALEVSDNFFEVFGLRPSAGRFFRPEESATSGPPVAILSEGFAQAWFGGAREAVGRNLTVNGRALEVVGVAPAGFRYREPVDLWVPMRRDVGIAAMPRGFHNWLLIGRLKPGVTQREAQAETNTVAARLAKAFPEADGHKGLRLTPLQADLVERQKPRLFLLLGAVSLLLAIACTNVAGLVFVRGDGKRGEFAIRTSLGAGRAWIVGPILTECLLLALTGGVLGCFLARIFLNLVPLVSELGDLGIGHPSLSWPVLLAALALSLGTGILSGILPALRLSRVAPGAGMGTGIRQTDGREGVRFRNSLVVVQLALAMVLLVLTGTLGHSLARLLHSDPGFRTSGLLTGSVPTPGPAWDKGEDRARLGRNLRDALAALPGVDGATVADALPILDGGNTYTLLNPAQVDTSGAPHGNFHLRSVGPGYFSCLGIPLLSGRDVSENDGPDAPGVVLLNRRTAQVLFPGQDPLGQTLLAVLGGNAPRSLQVVGLVGDVNLQELGSEPDLAFYLPYRQSPPRSGLRFALRTALPPSALRSQVREVVARLAPDVPVADPVPMGTVLRESLAPENEAAFTLALFAGFALVLSALGVFGVVSFVVGRRTREIGIRMALGASPSSILHQVAGDSLRLGTLGIALGYLASLAAGRFLASQITDLQPSTPLIPLGAAAGVALVALVGALAPAWRASRTHPMQALRREG
jgi:putative ABC transport system permease protein